MKIREESAEVARQPCSCMRKQSIPGSPFRPLSGREPARLQLASGIAMASEITSIQTLRSTSSSLSDISLAVIVSKDEWDCFADGVAESSDIAPVKVEIPEICAKDQEILDAVSRVADSFNFKLKMQQEESLNLSKVKMFSCLYRPDLVNHCVTTCWWILISSKRKAKRA